MVVGRWVLGGAGASRNCSAPPPCAVYPLPPGILPSAIERLRRSMAFVMASSSLSSGEPSVQPTSFSARVTSRACRASASAGTGAVLAT